MPSEPSGQIQPAPPPRSWGESRLHSRALDRFREVVSTRQPRSRIRDAAPGLSGKFLAKAEPEIRDDRSDEPDPTTPQSPRRSGAQGRQQHQPDLYQRK